MINRHNITLLILILGIYSCVVNRANISYIGNWTETELDYSESISFQEENDLLGIITSEKWCCGTSENYKWLRKQENLLMTFNVLKQLGLKRVLSEDQYRTKLFEDDYWDYDWEGFSLDEIVKKMISTYSQKLDTTNYYHKFWERRKSENNSEAVIQILKEVDDFYNQKEIVNIDNYDSKLFNLIKFNIELNESNSMQKNNVALSYFNYLKEIGLEHSAYNLIFELESTKNITVNKDSILNTLSFDTIPEDIYWRTRNNAEWIKTYRDNGP